MNEVQFEQPAARKGLAVASMVLGIVSVFGLGLLTGIPAIIMGCVALSRMKNTVQPQGGKGMAMAGVATGLGGMVMWLVLAAFIYSAYVAATTRAKLIADRARDQSNVVELTRSARLYAQRNNAGGNLFPPRLAASYRDVTRGPLAYVAPQGSSPMVTPPADADWMSFSEVLDEHCDYTYIGADLCVRDAFPPGVIVVYSKDSHLGGRSIGFIDGHVEFVDRDRVDDYFEHSNLARQRMRLPPVVLDGTPPAPRAVPQFAPGAPPAMPPGIPRMVERAPMRVPGPYVPPTTPERTGFNSTAEALEALTGRDIGRKRDAIAYLERAPVDGKLQKSVSQTLEACLADAQFSSAALAAMRQWATKENAPGLRAMLERQSRVMVGAGSEKATLIQLLVRLEDRQSAQAVAACLKDPSVRDQARQALIGFGSDVEEALWPIAVGSDSAAAAEAIDALGKIGTPRSIPTLEKVMVLQSAAQTQKAMDAARAIAQRNNLSPEGYLKGLINHYTIEAPAGFASDVVVEFNTLQWSKTGPGRSVKSVFTVEVKKVARNYLPVYKDDPPAVIECEGGFTFRQESVSSGKATKTAKWSAIDRENVIEVTVVVDTFDTAAQQAMFAAVKKIKVKQ